MTQVLLQPCIQKIDFLKWEYPDDSGVFSAVPVDGAKRDALR